MRSPESTEPNGSGALALALFQGSMQKLCARRLCCARCHGRLPECYGVRCPRSPRRRAPESTEPEKHCATSPCCAVAWTPLQSPRPPATNQAALCPPRCQAPSLRQEGCAVRASSQEDAAGSPESLKDAFASSGRIVRKCAPNCDLPVGYKMRPGPIQGSRPPPELHKR
jgi:hypothetical protein